MSGKPWIYPYQESKSELRTNKHRLEVLAREPTEKKPIFGLRGVSAIENLVSVPEDVVIDYMHQVLLGVVKKTVSNIVRQRKFFGTTEGACFPSAYTLYTAFSRT